MYNPFNPLNKAEKEWFMNINFQGLDAVEKLCQEPYENLKKKDLLTFEVSDIAIVNKRPVVYFRLKKLRKK